MKTFQDGWQKFANTFLLATITLLITVGGAWIRYIELDNKEAVEVVNTKLDTLMLATLANSSQIKADNVADDIWQARILALETGRVRATEDRITKTEALAAVENLRRWVEKYYERKP